MGKTVFVDGDLATQSPGTTVWAAFLNLIFNHRHDGGNQDGSAPLDFSADSGAVNALVATLVPAITALTVGMPFGVQVANTNTGATTLAVNGLGPYPLHKLGNVPLVAGDIVATQIIQVAWDGANFQLLTYSSPSITDAQTLQGQNAAALAPPGVKGEFFMPTSPPGWLPCQGQAVLRAQYPALFAAIGTTWGAGDTITTFNLPEVRGEHFRAWDDGRGVDTDRVFGSWQADGVGPHDHTYNTLLGTDPQSGGATQCWVGTAPATTGINVGPGENRVRNIAVLVCIKY